MNKYFLLLLSLVPFNLAAQQPQWELFFPDISGPIAVDPTDSDIIYIAGDSCDNCANYGMWKTTDGGESWSFYDEDWGMARPADIFINPDNPQEILVGGAPFVAVQKSTDGGKTWINASNGIRTDHHGYDVRQLAYDRQQGIYYLADLSGGAIGGVYKSTDGINWQLSPPYFLPTSIILDEPNKELYVGSDRGFWKSTDGGDTWVMKNNGLPTPSQLVWHIAKVPNSPTFYCALRISGIYKTLDGGENWFSVNDSVTRQLDFRGGLVVAETDTNVIFAGARFSPVSVVRGLYLTRNGGESWEQYNLGLRDTVLNFSTRNLFFSHQSNSLLADISLLFSDGGFGKGIYRLSNAIITEVSKKPERVAATDLNIVAYPNPFNLRATLVLTVPVEGHIVVRIFNILGKEVMPLLDEPAVPGEYHIQWGGTNREGQQVPSGIYLVCMRLGENTKTTKLLLLK